MRDVIYQLPARTLVVTCARAGVTRSWENLIVVLDIHLEREAGLLEIGHATGRLGLLLRSRHGGQQHRRQNRDDGDYDEKFDQRKPAGLPSPLCTNLNLIQHTGTTEAILNKTVRKGKN